MRSTILAGLMLSLLGCGGPQDDTTEHSHLDHQRAPEPPRRSQPEFEREAVTVGDIARSLGVHVTYIGLANQACYRHWKCRPDAGIPSVYDCHLELIKTWCPPGACDIDKEEPGWDACFTAVRSQPCDKIDEPIDCELLRTRGLDYRPTDWP